MLNLRSRQTGKLRNGSHLNDKRIGEETNSPIREKIENWEKHPKGRKSRRGPLKAGLYSEKGYGRLSLRSSGMAGRDKKIPPDHWWYFSTDNPPGFTPLVGFPASPA